MSKPVQGRYALNCPHRPPPREPPLERSLGRETQRLQSHSEGPCAVFTLILLEKKHSYLSNWSPPLRGEIPRSDGLIWEKNWLRSIPGTRFGHLGKIFNISECCSLSAWVSSFYAILHFKDFIISTNRCMRCQNANLTKISLALSICSINESYKNV